MRIFIAFSSLVFGQSLLASALPMPLVSKYAYLNEQQLITNKDGSKELGEARLFLRDGIRVLYLKGDRYEMAFQHGRLVQDVFASGAMPKIAAMIESAARNSFPKIPGVVDPIIEGIYRTYSNSIINHSSKKTGVSFDEYVIEAYGLAAGSGYPIDKIIYAFLSPEILQIILGQQMRGQKDLPAPTAVNECTDFAIPPERSLSGDYIIGRNTDYSLNNYFDKYPTVIYYHPTDGAQHHMTVTSAGVHTAGVVGYNASGLFLGVHTIPTWDASSKGHPAFDVGQHVLRTARSFDDAVGIFKTMLPGAGWAYTLVSTKENRTATIELSNSKLSVRETTGHNHIQTNHYLSSEMLSRNLDINATINEDTRARYYRTESLLNSHSGLIDVRKAISILADKTDPLSGQVKGLGNVIATHFTVTSTVIDTGSQSLYVASGLAPASLTKFIQLPLIEIFNSETFLDAPYDTITDDRYHHEYPNQSLAEKMYIQAKNAYEIEMDARKSRSLLNHVILVDQHNPAYLYMLGLMEIKTGDPDRAKKTLGKCAAIANGHYELTCRYFSAKLDANNGNAQSAIQELEAILTKANPRTEMPLIRAIKKNLKTLKRTNRVRFNPDTLSIFMPEGDVLSY
jgi:predicted choloylglycine hydrolase/predicted aconitase with swiveling domain